MDFDNFKMKVEWLYFEFLAIHRFLDGCPLKGLPNRLRPHYESVRITLDLHLEFDQIADLTLDEKTLVAELASEIRDDVMQAATAQILDQIHARRQDFWKPLLEQSPERISSHIIPSEPLRKDGHRKPFKQVVANAEMARKVFICLQNGGTHESVASEMFHHDTYDEKETKNAIRRVRQLKKHADILMQAVGNGPEAFFEAMQKPLSKIA